MTKPKLICRFQARRLFPCKVTTADRQPSVKGSTIFPKILLQFVHRLPVTLCRRWEPSQTPQDNLLSDAPVLGLSLLFFFSFQSYFCAKKLGNPEVQFQILASDKSQTFTFLSKACALEGVVAVQSNLLLNPAAPGSILDISILLRIINDIALNSGQRLNNIYRTHGVLNQAFGILDLQKTGITSELNVM